MTTTHRSLNLWRIATALVVVAIVTLLVVGAGYLATANADLRAQVQASHDDLRTSQANAESLYQQLLQEGVEPAAEKPSDLVSSTPGTPGSQGLPGIPGLPGRDGEDGTPGQPGAPGIPGEPGKPGSPGSPGTDGTDGTPGQDGGAGGSGPAGSNGADGRDGRGIADIQCQEDATWLITYTDGTTSVTSGPCRLVAAPEATPTP